MKPEFVESAQSSFPIRENIVTLGAPLHENECHPEPLVSVPLAMMNRHGLIAGATGTGKSKTLQLIAEQLSAQGVPVFLADLKGDLSGLGAPGNPHPKIDERAEQVGYPWHPTAMPVEFLSLSGKLGAQLRATVSSFGPLLLAKVLGLNDTQTSVLTLVFKYCDDRNLLLLDLSDLREVLKYLSNEGAGELEDYGGMAKSTVGVLLREMVELEHQGAERFFGEPEFDLDDLFQTERDGRGLVSVLELRDVQDKPALFSTFMMWMLATLYAELPEVGDPDKPKLVFFFDEAHLLFDGASKEFVDQVETIARLIRSKGVGVFFVTQNPKDVPADVLGQLGHRVQHALRAFTPDDEKQLRATARTFPKTDFYDIEETLTTLGIGEALITTLGRKGRPSPPFATRLVAPVSRMSPLEDSELTRRLDASDQVKEYSETLDRESAREVLAERAKVAAEKAEKEEEEEGSKPARRGRKPKEPPSALAQALNSPLFRDIARTATRGLLGALGIKATRRRRRTRRRR